MKKTPLFITALLLMLSACGGQKPQEEKVETAVADTAATASVATDSTALKAKAEIVGIINKLYAAASKNEGDIDGRFACHVWRDTVDAVNAKDAQLEEIGFFNDDYWTMMQDSNPDDLEARDIQFEQLDVAKGRALVDFVLHSSIQTVHMKFLFCRDDADWRVHDIIRFFDDIDGTESSFSFMKSMQGYLSKPLEE
ncbi:MAG: hypothetical protein IKW98_10555 [Prevotella sp.]|nr:hypothetical protein [Prevotella sp.]